MSDAGRHAVVYEHRRVEVSFGEEARDVREVLPDCAEVLRVRGVVDFDLYKAAVAREDEMMRRRGLRESHRLRAAFIDCGEVRAVLAFARRLRLDAARRGAVRVRLGALHHRAVGVRRVAACRVLTLAASRGLRVPVVLRAYGDGGSGERDAGGDGNHQHNLFYSFQY